MCRPGQEDPLPYLLPPQARRAVCILFPAAPSSINALLKGCWDEQPDSFVHLFLYMYKIYAHHG